MDCCFCCPDTTNIELSCMIASSYSWHRLKLEVGLAANKVVICVTFSTRHHSVVKEVSHVPLLYKYII